LAHTFQCVILWVDFKAKSGVNITIVNAWDTFILKVFLGYAQSFIKGK